MSKNIITATDISNANSDILREVEENVKAFNRKRIRRTIAEKRKLLRIELNDENADLSREDLSQIKLEIDNDQESMEFRKNETKNLLIQKGNYIEVRKNIDGLNDIWTDSLDIERVKLQKIDNFLNYDELVLTSTELTHEFFKVRDRFQLEIVQSINGLVKEIDHQNEQSRTRNEDYNYTSLQLILKLRDMYQVTLAMDDFEVFDLYGLDSNIDVSHTLGRIFLYLSASNNADSNVLNIFSKSESSGVKAIINMSKLIKTKIVTDKLLGMLLGEGYVSNNQVTMFDNTWTNNTNLARVFRTRTLGELLIEITNPERESVDKAFRPQIYMTYGTIRPSKDDYYKWNGMQVFDLDLKEWIRNYNGNIDELKSELHSYLVQFHWYLWICTSSSGKGLHIYTKVTPPHHVYSDIIKNNYISEYWYKVNYLTKQSVIYEILYAIRKDKRNFIDFPDEFENPYLDNVVQRITAGIRLSQDPNPLVNNNFIDLHCGWALGQTVEGYQNHPAINEVLLRDTKIRTMIDKDLAVSDISEYRKVEEIDLSKFVSLGADINNINPLPRSNINYIVRYNVCNTLASLFGKDGLPIAHKILDSHGCNNVGEINSFYSCAISNGKEPSKYGLEVLKKTGIIKSVDNELLQKVEDEYKSELINQIEKSLNNQLLENTFNLTKNQYLSDIKDSLQELITGEKINIIFSPAGSGKCFGKGTGILMFDGSSKKVEDILPGELVMGWDSKPRKVLSTCKGRENMYRIVPKFGQPWECNESHILSLHTMLGYEPKILNIELGKFLKLPEKTRKIWRQFTKEVEFPEKDLEIDPYFLGYWLGDGTANDVEFTIGNEDVDEILPILSEYVEDMDCHLVEYKYDSMTCPRYRAKSNNFDRQYNNRENNKNNCYIKFEKYNLIGNKHIPEDFLRNSRENRLKLFAGIIDSDGTIATKSYSISISIKYEKFKNDLIYLARSLGYYVNCSIKNAKLNGKVYPQYFLTISGELMEVPVVYKRKKHTKLKKNLTKYSSFEIEPLGEGDYYGFELDGPDKMFLKDDFVVVHNTEYLKKLAKDGKRVMLVIPYISIIRNKIETDEEINALFDSFYGNFDLKQMEFGRNVVTTFDKFSRINYEKLSRMFDYIFIDESHLLFTSSYRIEATSNVIKRLKEAHFISSNDPMAAKLVLMTGTETGETYYFQKFANIIRVAKPMLNKEMEFLICGDTLDAITRMASKAADLLQRGYRLMIPTNKGEIYSEKIIGMIQYLLQRPVKYGYYKRSNTEQEICRLINEDNSIGDFEIVFCSNYLSVGVDINDKHLFASLYLGNFSGYEIEQFNARIRKTGIKSIYCIVTTMGDGTTNDLLLSEPDLVLKITEEDQLHFIDDKAMASAKTEFLATYDPILHKITTPGFSLFQGKIQFNLEEYELVSFENKFSVCMEHPVKVSRELAKYGYKITVSKEFEGLSLEEQDTLKQMGLNAAKEEKIRKHNLLVGTYIDLIKSNTYISQTGLEYNNVIDYISKNQHMIIEDRDLTIDVLQANGELETQPCYVKVIHDVFAVPQKIIVRSKEALDKMLKSARYIASRYSAAKAMDIIYQYVDDNGILKQKHFQRSINLLKLMESSDANELADPLVKIIEKMYILIDKFEMRKDYKIGYESYQSTIDAWTYDYIDMLGIKINTKYGFEKIRNGIVEMLQDIATKQQSKNGVRLLYNKIPDQDSTLVLNRRSVDSIVTNMFNITGDVVVNKTRERHILLVEQSF